METRHTRTSEGDQALIERVLNSELVRGAIEGVLHYLIDCENNDILPAAS